MKLRRIGYTKVGADGTRAKRKSAKWYGVFVDFNGVLRRLALFEDRRASESMSRIVDRLNSLRSSNDTLPPDLARAVDEMPTGILAKLAAWDVIRPQKAATAKPLSEHVKDWRAALLAKGGTEHHADTSANRVQRIIGRLELRTISDVSASRVQAFLAELRQDWKDAKKKVHRGISAATFNYYLRDARSFFAWMVGDCRAFANPLASLKGKGVNVRTDRRHDRRALSVDELRWLMDTTATGPERYGMTAAARQILYRLAVESGLRSAEIRSLKRANFRLTGERPAVTVACAYTKNRKAAELPLRADTAAALERHFVGKMPSALAFAMPKADRIVEMFQADLAAARGAWLKSHQIAKDRLDAEGSDFLLYRDSANRVIDFHALRHTFISNLAAGGVHPKTAQMLARHSTITLTMDRYTHQNPQDLAGALDVLPDLSGTKQVAVASGTDGKISASKSLSPSLSPNRAFPCISVESGEIKTDGVTSPQTLAFARENTGFPRENVSLGLLAELADAMDSKSITARCIGSTPIEAIFLIGSRHDEAHFTGRDFVDVCRV